MKTTFGAVLLAIIMAFPAFALAQMGTGTGMGGGMMGYGPGRGMGPGTGYGPGGWTAGLNLSPDQVQKLETLHANFFKETIPQRNELAAAQMDLRALWSQPNPDPAQVMAKQKQINSLRGQIQEKALQYRLEARKVLTPEQQAQLGPYGISGLFSYGTGMGRGYGMGMGSGYGPGYGRGYGRGYGCRNW